MVSSGNFSVPYICGDMLKNMIPCTQNELVDFAGNESACETGKLAEEIILFTMLPFFKNEDECFTYAFTDAYGKYIRVIINILKNYD